MAKDRALNPATAHHKLEKQKALKKSKAQIAAQRTERLAHRNPHRLEAQIAELYALKESSNSSSGGGGKTWSARDQKQLEELERDVARVKRAREVVGVSDKAPQLGRKDGGSARREDTSRGGGGAGGKDGGRATRYGGLGKRSRAEPFQRQEEQESEEEEEDEEEMTDEEVRRIPMPRDTPPPVPQRRMDYRRHHRRAEGGTNANREPISNERYPDRRRTTTTDEKENHDETIVPDTSLPAKPATGVAAAAPKMTYESQPQVRDLRKEATTARFVPSAVKRKIDATRGAIGGRLLEEEEMVKLEREGYGYGHGDGNGQVAGDKEKEKEGKRVGLDAATAPAVGGLDRVDGDGMDEVDDDVYNGGGEGEEGKAGVRRWRDEEEAFRRALMEEEEEEEKRERPRQVEIEEVRDEEL